MELRVLHYFLTVAKEQSFTRAAEQLHITQPTLSRQLAALEEEFGTALFDRSGRKITLTDEGLLLKRRALEMIDLEDKITDEIKGNDAAVEGVITIGSGEFTAVETLAEILHRFKKKYPRVQIALHTGTADMILERMQRGLIDIGLFMEPVSKDNLEYVQLPDSDCWVVSMRPDDPLAEKEVLTKEDLIHLPLILPERPGVQSELANWFGKDFDNLNISFTSNLGTNGGVMAVHGLGYPLSVQGAIGYWRPDLLVQRKLYPDITAHTVIAWRRNIPYAKAVRLLIQEINAYA